MRQLAWIAAFFVVFGVGYGAGWISPHRSFLSLDRVQGIEKQRLTDPSGQFDAVLLMEPFGGAAGGINWYVCLVQKGRPAASAGEAVVMVADAKAAKLIWREPHLLDFSYERAMIMDFTNLWGSNTIKTRTAFSGGNPYWIEVRLAPSSPDFSLLTPDNSFK